ncbi:hypothetical protein SLS55_001088 [Diplodia seriata]|uniref:Uncharacterized protein n=1 Tax=Diplodia seriata TaxID=420778 RepID=A0ABR3CX61_9PEZI
MVSLWTSGEARAQDAAVQMHERFMVMLHEQRDKWDVSYARAEDRKAIWPMGIYQSILLQVIFAMMRSNADGDANRSRPRLPLAMHELLGRVVKSCLRLGMFQYPKMLDQYDHVGFAFLTWVYVEEVKRFGLVLFRVWTLCYGASSIFSVSELRFPLPESDYLWEADAIGELVRRREKEVGEGSGVREEEQFWIANMGIDGPELALSWRHLANSKGQGARVLT